MKGGGNAWGAPFSYERIDAHGTGKCDRCTLGADVVGPLEGVQEWEAHTCLTVGSVKHNGLYGVRLRRLMLCARCSAWARRQGWRAPLEFDVPMPVSEAAL